MFCGANVAISSGDDSGDGSFGIGRGGLVVLPSDPERGALVMDDSGGAGGIFHAGAVAGSDAFGGIYLPESGGDGRWVGADPSGGDGVVIVGNLQGVHGAGASGAPRIDGPQS